MATEGVSHKERRCLQLPRVLQLHYALSRTLSVYQELAMEGKYLPGLLHVPSSNDSPD